VNADDVVCGMRRAVMGNDLQLLRWVSMHNHCRAFSAYRILPD
jgi:hypothetical protein